MSDKNSSAPSGAMTEEEKANMARFIRSEQQNRSASTPDHTPVSRSADRVGNIIANINLPGTRQLYAIIDIITDTIIGGVQVHLNHQSAIRTLYDIAMGDTSIHKHPRDYELWMLGALGADHKLHPRHERIITGDQIDAIVNSRLAKDDVQPSID